MSNNHPDISEIRPVGSPPNPSNTDYAQKEVITEKVEELGSDQSSSKFQSENPMVVSIDEGEQEEQPAKKPGIIARIKQSYPKWRWVVFLLLGLFFTAWWVSIIAQKKHRHKWLIPTVFYGMVIFRIITLFIPVDRWIMKVLRTIWFAGLKIRNKLIPEKFRLLSGAILTVAVMLIGTMVPTETKDSKRVDRFISFIGMAVAILGLWATSTARSQIRWITVINGMLMQFIIALFVLRTGAGFDIFKFISDLAEEFLGFAKNGVAFVTTPEISQYTYFFFTVLPAVLFFIAVVSVLLYLGFIQWGTGKFAKFFYWSMKVSGGEAVVAAASPFIGIGESAVLIKEILPQLTTAEIHQIMCSGFATISGSVLISYIGIGINSQALVSSCVMSIPASLSVSKLRYPEVENPITAGDFKMSSKKDEVNLTETPQEKAEREKREEEEPKNILHAFSNGAVLGIQVAGNILASQVCIISFVALLNGVLTWFGKFWNIKALTLELMGGYILYPVAFLLGAPRDELKPIAELIAMKFIENEYNGYTTLINKAPYNQMSKRGQLLATYSLCGFANLGSVGTQISVLNTLCKAKTGVVVKTITSALLTGAISTLLSACVAGMVIHDLSDFKVSNKE